MPRLSDSMDEGQLIEWKIRPGDILKNGDVIAEVESDKAVMEIQTFKSGTVKKILTEAGTMVPVGTAIAVIDTDASVSGADSAVSKVRVNSDVAVKREEVPQSKKIETVEAVSPGPNEPKNESEKEVNPLDIILGLNEEKRVLKHSYTGGNSSPRARALAAKYGLEIGMLQKEEKLPLPAHLADVKHYWLQHYFTPKALALIEEYHLSTDLFETEKKHDESEVKHYIEQHEIPLPKTLNIMQKAMIAMVEEAMKKPVYHMSDHIDVTLVNKHADKELTVTVWLLKLFAEAMMRQKHFRMTLTDGSIQLWPNASISLAMANGEDLYMPVFRDVNGKTAEQLAKQIQSFKTKIKERTLAKEDMSGSTFGISNLGMTGIESFDAMINKNDCAIAAIGSEIDDRISVTLTVDHRIVNGYQAAQFMQILKTLAIDPLFFKEANRYNLEKGKV